MTQEIYDQPGTLQTATRKLLKESPLTVPELYKESGLPFYWLRGFTDNKFKNPSCNRVQYLYEFLTKKKLDV